MNDTHDLSLRTTPEYFENVLKKIYESESFATHSKVLESSSFESFVDRAIQEGRYDHHSILPIDSGFIHVEHFSTIKPSPQQFIFNILGSRHSQQNLPGAQGLEIRWIKVMRVIASECASRLTCIKFENEGLSQELFSQLRNALINKLREYYPDHQEKRGSADVQPGNRSGGVDLNANEANIVGNVVGRDNLQFNFEAGSTAIFDERRQLDKTSSNAIDKGRKASNRLTETNIVYRREIVAKANQLRQDNPNMKWKEIAHELSISESTLRKWRRNSRYR